MTQAASAYVTGWEWSARFFTMQRESQSFLWDFVIPEPEQAEPIIRLDRNVRRTGTGDCSVIFRMSG
jgi:hypothetical protein